MTHRRQVRTFARRGRINDTSAAARVDLWPLYGVSVVDHDVPALDFTALFGRSAPVVLEIGFGMGDATAKMAADDPGRNYLAVDVHAPGQGNLLQLIHSGELSNLRVADGDALELLRHQVAADSLDAIHIYFPDPWPKVKHHKRRLVQPEHLPLLRSRLRPGGVLHMATDWEPYAKAALAALTAEPGLVNTYEEFADRPKSRPVTKFERRGLKAGREVFDLIFRRAGSGSASPTMPSGRAV